MEIIQDYPCNPDNYQGKRTQPVKYLVIHYVGALGGARANAIHYHNNMPKISAHYFVGHADEDAAIYASVAEDCVASHCGCTDGLYWHPECRNANSIGIEMCCHQSKGGVWYFDPETVDQTVELARDIMGRYGIPITHVLRHYDVTGKICPAPFVNEPEAWDEFKGRLEGSELTREEVQALIEAAKPATYTDIAQVPKWAQGLVQRAIEAGILKGDQNGRINLTDLDLKTLSMLERAGMLKGGAV